MIQLLKICIVEFILLKDALTEMETLVAGESPRFDIIASTYDQGRDTGGKLLVLKNVKLSHLNGKSKNAVPDEFKRPNEFVPKVNKNPHHKENRTKNFMLPNGEIRKAHIHFILFFNNQQIIQ